MRNKKILVKIYTLIILLITSCITIAEEFNGKENNIFYSYSIEDNEFKDSFFNLEPDQNTEVLYFFNYNCFSCYMLDTHIYSWENTMKKQNIKFVRIPLSVHESWNYTSKLYFMMKILGFKNYNQEIFNLIHLDGYRFNSNEDIYKLFSDKYGFSRDLLNTPNHIKRLDYMYNKSLILSEMLNVDSTPTIIINDKNKIYRIRIKDGFVPMSFILSLQKALKKSSSS